MSEKTWDGEAFWGLGYEWDPDWVLSERQRDLRDTLIELCEKEMRHRLRPCVASHRITSRRWAFASSAGGPSPSRTTKKLLK